MIFFKRFLFCFGFLGLLASCMETNNLGSRPAAQTSNNVTMMTIIGYYRFVADCADTAIPNICAKDTVSIHANGTLRGIYHYPLSNSPVIYRRYSLNLSAPTSTSSTSSGIGPSAPRVVSTTKYTFPVSGTITKYNALNGEKIDTISVNGQATATSNSGLSFALNRTDLNFDIHRIYSNGTTRIQQIRGASNEAERRNLEEIQRSQETAAAVGAGLGIGTGNGINSNGYPVRIVTDRCITITRRGGNGNGGLSNDRIVKNSCGYPVIFRYCFSDKPLSSHFGCPSGSLVDLVRREYEGLSTTSNDDIGTINITANGTVTATNLQGDRPIKYIAHTCKSENGRDCRTSYSYTIP